MQKYGFPPWYIAISYGIWFSLKLYLQHGFQIVLNKLSKHVPALVIFAVSHPGQILGLCTDAELTELMQIGF